MSFIIFFIIYLSIFISLLLLFFSPWFLKKFELIISIYRDYPLYVHANLFVVVKVVEVFFS